MYIEAYDRVMVPNVYSLTQFADGGLMATKSYSSGSNYLLKMGAWPKGDWQATWDGLFWRFMHVNWDFFTRNPSLGMLVATFAKMGEAKRVAYFTWRTPKPFSEARCLERALREQTAREPLTPVSA